MEKIQKVNFNTNAKLGKLIGRELITNNIIAIFELIKNSYDAFADSVTIEFINFNTSGYDDDLEKAKDIVLSSPNSMLIISDNGEGMSFNELKTNWMEIGTTNKEGKNEEHRKRNGKEIVRIINGEKGIGRFGADKLGSQLLMESVDKTGTEKSSLQIDWSVFDTTNQSLQDISFDCAVTSKINPLLPSGLKLTISSLRDKWTGRDIINLKRQLKKMVSPFSQEKDYFNIYLKFEDHEERIINDSFDNAPTSIDASIDVSGILKYTIFDTIDTIQKKIQCDPPIFGPISVRILYMDSSSKKSFAKRYGVSTREYGNIKVFRDNFRILPYGEVENDWLGIDNKHAQAVFRSLGTRDIIGYVQITKVANPMLRDATNRQGLNEDTPEFQSFKTFVWQILDVLQNYIFDKLKKDTEKQGAVIAATVQNLNLELDIFMQKLSEILEQENVDKHTANLIINQANIPIKKLKQDVNTVEKANTQLRQRMIIMEKMVGTESMLYDILHAIKNKLDTLEASIRDLEIQAEILNLEIDSSFSIKTLREISTMVFAALKRTASSNKKKEYIDLSSIISAFIQEKRLVYPNIKFETNNISSVKIFCNSSGLRTVFDNLLSNSIKALNSTVDKHICISMKTEPNSISIFFEDNGPGIPDEFIPFIFNVSFSRTGGTGIGLSSSYHFMKDCKGDISYVKNGTLNGATFILTFPLK